MKRYGRLYSVRKRKSILRKRSFWFFILFLIMLGSLAHLFFFSSVFQIKQVRISGTDGISQEEIRAFFPGGNIFLLNSAEIKKDVLTSFPEIAEVKIDRNFPSTLNVEIEERVALLLWCNEDEECFLTDKTGKCFEQVSFAETELSRVFGEKELLTEKTVSQTLEIEQKAKKDLALVIEKVILVSSQRLDAKTTEGWEIYFNLEKDLTWQLTQLHLILERQISPEEREVLQYIDLRFEKVYYK